MHGRLTSVRKLLLPHGAPSRASYYRWRGVSKIAKAHVRRMGRRPRLNEAEKDVLAGRVLWRVHHPNPVSGDWVINWIRQTFGVTYSRPGVSKLLRSLGIRAHRTHSKTLSDTREPVVSHMRTALRTMRSAIAQRNDRSAIVAMDQMTFTSNGAVAKSYLAIGGGQPVALEPNANWRDILYVPICADFACLPGIVFTSDQSLIERDYEHITVLLVENTKAPGADMTMRWLDVCRDYLEDDPVLLLGNLGSHHHRPFQEDLRSLNVQVHFFSNQRGKYINPCDNSVKSIIC